MGSVDGGEAGSFSMASSLLDLHICGGTSTFFQIPLVSTIWVSRKPTKALSTPSCRLSIEAYV